MNKRGQIYILAAILLGVAIFTISVQVNKYSQEKETEDFKDLSDMFTVEGSKLANSVVLQGGDLESSFRNFTVMFTSYSKSQNPDYGLIYALPYQTGDGLNITYVGNFLDQYVIVSYYDSSGNIQYKELPGCLDTISPTLIFEGLTLSSQIDLSLIESCSLIITQKLDQVGLTIDGTGYVFQIKQDKPELVVVSREYLGDLSKVYYQGTMVESKEDTAVSNSEYCSSIKTQNDCLTSDLCVWRMGNCELGSCSSYKWENGCDKDPRCYWQCVYNEGCSCISMEEVPKCSDGTFYNTCNDNTGMFCDNKGQLTCNYNCCSGFYRECKSGDCVCKPMCYYWSNGNNIKKECGDDGCGGSCGECKSGKTCNDKYQCVTTCVPRTCSYYSGKCGTLSNGCGDQITCDCTDGYTCTNGNCVSSKAVLSLRFSNVQVTYSSGKYTYTHTRTFTETNGVGVTLKKSTICLQYGTIDGYNKCDPVPITVNYKIDGNNQLVQTNKKFETKIIPEKFTLTYTGTDDNGNPVLVSQSMTVNGYSWTSP